MRIQRFVGALAVLTAVAYARFDARPAQACEAYNNMKHTRNTHHVVLSTDRDYTVVKKHKGQYLLLIKGETPAQRWVDDACFSTTSHQASSTRKPKRTHTKATHPPATLARTKGQTQTILVLSWHNAFCETHPRKQECRTDASSDAGHLVLHGLWPQPRSNAYCNVPPKVIAKDKHHQWRTLPNIDTEPETLELMDVYMPGYVSYLHKHEWIKHGTCYGTSPDRYYHDALTLAQEVDRSRVGQLLKRHIGTSVTLGQIRQAFDRDFGAHAGQRVEMKCDRGLLTELWINLGDRGEHLRTLIQKGKKRKSRCRKAKIDPK
jgi:ribonuclease T2